MIQISLQKAVVIRIIHIMLQIAIVTLSLVKQIFKLQGEVDRLIFKIKIKKFLMIKIPYKIIKLIHRDHNIAIVNKNKVKRKINLINIHLATEYRQ